MAKKLVVQSGKHQVKLQKSNKLVGLRAKASKDLKEEEFVKESVFKNIGGFEVVQLEDSDAQLDEQLDQIRQKADIEVGTHVYVPEGSEKPVVPTGELVIVFEEGTGPDEQQLVLDEFYLELVERRDQYQVIAKVTSKSPNPIKVASFLQNISLVQRAEPDLDALLDEYDVRLPADTLLSHQWYFRNSGFIVDTQYPTKKGADAKIIDAWNQLGNMGDSNIVVAVIDNGFDLTHPDLQGKVYRPFDLWSQSSTLLQGDARFSHGTPCASLAIANSNGSGMVGVAPNAKFMPVSGTSFSLRATEQMFEYCLKNGADIISCSWGTTDPNFSLSPMKEAAISKAAREGRNGKGCIILFAAGNENKDMLSFYATHPDVIAVAATTSKDEHATYSNRGRQLSVAAPSNGDWPIIAARAWWDPGTTQRGTGDFKYWADGRSRGDRYKHFGGTSGATPVVAGICALMLSANPNLTAREVKQILQSTADKVGNSWEYVQGYSTKYGYGRVNAAKAVAEAIRRRSGTSTTTSTPTTTTTTTTPSVSTNTGNVTVRPTTGTTTSTPTTTTTSSSGNLGKDLYRFNVQPQVAAGWGVQVGVFASYGNVLKQASDLQRQFGQPILVQISSSGSSESYKLVVGSFNSSTDAQQLLNKLRGQGINGFVRNLSDFG